jgi:trimeric autotransporter adhesin
MEVGRSLLLAVIISTGYAQAQTVTLPAEAAIAPGQQTTLPLALSGPAPVGGVFITLSSSDTSNVVVSPSAVLIVQGATTVTRPIYVTGVAAGTAVISAAVYEMPTVNETITVTGSSMIILPAGLSLAPGQSSALSVGLTTPAPASGVTLTLTSSDTSTLAISPTTILVPSGATSPQTPPQITGVAAGLATITASAPGYLSASQSVQVQPSQPTSALTFSAGSLAIPGLITSNIQVNLSSPAPQAGLIVNLLSDTPSVATVPATITVPSGATSASIPITAVGAGTAHITAGAQGWTAASVTVTVTSGTDLVLPTGVSIQPGQTVNFPVTLANPAPTGGVYVSLSSSNPSVLTVSVPAVVIAQGATTSVRALQITGVANGNAVVSASAFDMTGTNATVQVGAAEPTMTFSPPTLTISGISSTQNLTLSLPALAPTEGLTASLSSTNPAVATVPPSVEFAAGTGTAVVPVTSVGAGSTVINASAPPLYGDTTASITVLSSPLITLSSNITLSPGQTVSFPIVLVNPAPESGLTVILSSSNPSTVSISPSSIVIPAGSFEPAVQPQITGVATGSATLSASAPGYGTATQVVTVQVTTISVTWYGACWVPTTIYGVTGNFQAIDFAMTTSNPVTVQGTLFFAANCDASQGTDNMNDYGTLTNSGNIIQGFTHHPNLIPSSAVYWMGPLTPNGLCAPGSPCSGCVNYTAATPVCSSLP